MMEDEVKALREEVAKLRERVAVLEAKQQPANNWEWKPQPGSDQYSPQWVNPAPNAAPSIPYSPSWTIRC